MANLQMDTNARPIGRGVIERFRVNITGTNSYPTGGYPDIQQKLRDLTGREVTISQMSVEDDSGYDLSYRTDTDRLILRWSAGAGAKLVEVPDTTDVVDLDAWVIFHVR